jgi:hypothetical protein
VRDFPQTRQHHVLNREVQMLLSRRVSVTTVLILVVTQSEVAFAQAAQPSASAAGSRVSDLAFMGGCWRGVTRSGTTIEEFYTAPTANQMLGVTRYVRDGRVVDFEFTRIDQTDSGAVLTPHPKAVRSVSFAPRVIESDRAVWENAAHDFPQRILYWRTSEDTLVARIEGKTPQGARSLEWRMARSTCGATAP